MLKKIFHKILNLLRVDAPFYFWRSGYLKKVGWLDSFHIKQPIDAKHQPIPWYTYPAIEYLKQLDFSDKKVFEYGSGNSTLFWSQICQKVISIEDNPEWHEKVLKSISSQHTSQAQLQLITDELSYVHALESYPDMGVIIIDGSYRFQCAKVAIKKLKLGGLIILDNSDWYVKTAETLRDADLIQVDMTGLGPINSYVWTTSFFFHRNFRFKPKSINQPEHGINAIKQYAEE